MSIDMLAYLIEENNIDISKVFWLANDVVAITIHQSLPYSPPVPVPFTCTLWDKPTHIITNFIQQLLQLLTQRDHTRGFALTGTHARPTYTLSLFLTPLSLSLSCWLSVVGLICLSCARILY